jgi:hypothetical protein
MKTFTLTLPEQRLLKWTMTALVLPTSHQVLPTENSLSSRASFWRYSTLGSIPEHTFCNNKFNLFKNISQQNSSTRHDFGEVICALLGYYAAYSGNSLPKLCDR